jgi:chaperone required for assembly of F1-ATPase
MTAGGRDGRKTPGREPRALPRRFYKSVTVGEAGAEHRVLLDGKAMRTPAKATFVVPTRALAEAIAVEWEAQREHIDPATMPLTKLANSAIDGVPGREDAVIGDILNYAGSDLLCYRAEGPRGLIEAQRAHWDPVLAWAKSALGAPFALAEGIVHVAQPQASLDRLREALKRHGPFGLAALHVMTGLTGSALLALAVALGRVTPEEAWDAAHLDEDWQIAQWGADAEAASRRAARRRDFDAAARALALLKE